jgi:hypothetical protein
MGLLSDNCEIRIPIIKDIASVRWCRGNLPGGVIEKLYKLELWPATFDDVLDMLEKELVKYWEGEYKCKSRVCRVTGKCMGLIRGLSRSWTEVTLKIDHGYCDEKTNTEDAWYVMTINIPNLVPSHLRMGFC